MQQKKMSVKLKTAIETSYNEAQRGKNRLKNETINIQEENMQQFNRYVIGTPEKRDWVWGVSKKHLKI